MCSKYKRVNGGWWVLRGNSEGKEEEEEGSDFPSKCLGQTWVFVRHCNSGAGTITLKKNKQKQNSFLFPYVTWCITGIFVSYYYFIFLHYPDPQGVTHRYFLCILFISHCYAALCEIQPHIITGGIEQTGDAPTGQSLLVTWGSLINSIDDKIHTRTPERCNTLDGKSVENWEWQKVQKDIGM